MLNPGHVGVIENQQTEDAELAQRQALLTPRHGATRPGPGRPAVLPEAERRRRIFDAAGQVFIDRGYGAATMGAVALAAGMSKKTLYQLFASKLALFDALLEDRIFQWPAAAQTSGGTQQESLTALLLEIAGILLRPDRTGLIRLIVRDGQSAPELMSAFERLRLNSNLNALEVWLQREQESGALAVGDVSAMARILFGMTIAEPILLALMNAPSLPDELPLEQRIGMAVGIFLRGVRG